MKFLKQPTQFLHGCMILLEFCMTSLQTFNFDLLKSKKNLLFFKNFIELSINDLKLFMTRPGNPQKLKAP